MTQLISFEDAVNAANLNPEQLYGVYYCDGLYANHAAVAARCPHARLYAVTTRGATGHGIFACDSEASDLDFSETVAWVAEQIRLGVELICVYADLDRWLNEGLKNALDHYGARIRRWVADFNKIPTIQPWADAEQYATGNVDRNVALARFFANTPPAPRPVHEWSAQIQVTVPDGSIGDLNFAGTLKLEGGHWTAHGTDGDVHFSGPGGGEWRAEGMKLDSKPLGGK